MYIGSMSEIINKNRINRYRLLAALYEWADGNIQKWIDLKGLCQNQGVPFDEAAYHYLIQEGLIKQYGAGYTCYLMHSGVKAIEQAYENPAKDSQYFPAVNTIPPVNGSK